MRAYREDLPVSQPRRGVYAALAGVVLVVAMLAYFALRDAAEPVTETPLAELSPVESVTLPTQTNTNPSVEPPAATNTPAVTADFLARELAPPRVAVGVGEAPVVQRQSNDTFVINGELLEKLEAEAPPRPVIE